MITLEHASQDLYDLLRKLKLIDFNTYEFDELEAIIIEITKGSCLQLYEF